MTLENFVKKIQRIMRKDPGIDGDAQRISQLVWMLFLKIFDTKEEEWELVEDEYISVIPKKYQWRNWAGNEEGMTGDELLNFVNNELFEDLRKIEIDEYTDERKILVKEIFSDSYNYMKSGTLMRQVINKINQVQFDDYEERHSFNDIYESILKDLQSAGNAGEFYTPRPLTDFVIEMLEPKIGESIADFACGTGGFLVSSLEYLRNKNPNMSVEQRKIILNSIYGVEKKPMPYMLCVTNMILHDVDIPNIIHGNSLTNNVRDYNEKDKFDVIAMNPPFGGEEQEMVKRNFPKLFQTSETADLFMALIMYRLKNSGRAGVVLPDGFLFDNGAKTNIKKELLNKFNLHTIVRLPEGVFEPYAQVNVNLLFIDGGSPTEEIWFYEHPLPEDYKKYTKTKPIRPIEFSLERNWWNNRKENKYAWKISIDDIEKNNYNLDFKNPHQDNKKPHSTDEIVSNIKVNMKRSKIILRELEEVLKDGNAS
ncbi:MAG: N-6 DNA methylase [Candidatus Woesearchaeota archaeon]